LPSGGIAAEPTSQRLSVVDRGHALEGQYLPNENAVMTSLTDVGFMPMRLGKMVALADQDGSSFYVVLAAVMTP
jgi:hypothetical protein